MRERSLLFPVQTEPLTALVFLTISPSLAITQVRLKVETKCKYHKPPFKVKGTAAISGIKTFLVKCQAARVRNSAAESINKTKLN